VTDQEEHAIEKKARFAIELASRPKSTPIPTPAVQPPLPKTHQLPKTRSSVVSSITDADASVIVSGVGRKKQQQQQHRLPSPPKQAEIATQTEPEPIFHAKKPINHHEKVVNGIKHELDRLQPAVADLKVVDEKRKLRSQEGAWFKSELSAYLPEYDMVIGNILKEEREFCHWFLSHLGGCSSLADILDLDTPIVIVDSAKPSTKQMPSPRKSNGLVHEYPLKEFPDSLFTNLYDAHKVDFSFMDRNWKEEGGEDPLSDVYFETIHRKPERLEKTIRNADKGRAQHEKDQVMRLLEGLQGHDWLKLMGVSGVTESKKKEYEPARDHFIRGCEALIEKFRWWREEEKRRKLEKEAAMAEAEAEAEEVEGEEEVDEEDNDDAISDGDPPDYSDVDASAARQLHEEAIARSAPLSKHPGKRAKVEPLLLGPRELQEDFISFFKKPHLREAALGKTRRSGRSAAAWGHPVPEISQADFDLPEEFRDEETLKIHARRKRRDRRMSKN
jgi:hypothetical protein